MRKFISLALALSTLAATGVPNASLKNGVGDKVEYKNINDTEQLVLVDDGKINYYVTDVDGNCEREVTLFNEMMNKVTGVDTSEPAGKIEVVIDTYPFSDNFDPECERLAKKEGFLIAEHDGKLMIYGQTEETVRWAVYDFFEDNCGCKYLTSTVDYIPHSTTVGIEKDEFNLELPYFDYRLLEYYDVNFGDYYAKHKLGGAVSRTIGHLWHTLPRTIIPTAEYYEKHPEWYAYSEVKGDAGTGYASTPDGDGYRIASIHSNSDSQLCMSNDELIAEIIKVLGEQMAKSPSIKYWGVSIGDGTAGICQCENCNALAEAAGGRKSGTLFYLINKVAEAFPDKIITTMMYSEYDHPPLNMECPPNVMVHFVNYGAHVANGTDEESVAVREKFEEWKKFCRMPYWWSGVIDFGNLMCPTPHSIIMQENIQYFYENGITMLFMQGNREPGGFMSYLNAYVTAKLMWNPYIDVDAVIDEFTTYYYGAAGEYMKEYYYAVYNNYMEDHNTNGTILRNDVENEEIYNQSWTTPEKIKEYLALVEKGIEAVGDDETLIERLEEDKMALVYLLNMKYKFPSPEEAARVMEDIDFLEKVYKRIEARYNAMGGSRKVLVCEYNSVEMGNFIIIARNRYDSYLKRINKK